jgi:hypothetical protein
MPAMVPQSVAMRSLVALAAVVSLLVVAVAHPRAQCGPAAGDWPNHGGQRGLEVGHAPELVALALSS